METSICRMSKVPQVCPRKFDGKVLYFSVLKVRVASLLVLHAGRILGGFFATAIGRGKAGGGAYSSSRFHIWSTGGERIEKSANCTNKINKRKWP